MANSNVNVLQTVIQLRRGTEEQWNLVKDSFIPREGEPCTTIYGDGRDALVKIGDGKHTWGELGYTRDSFLVTVSQSGDKFVSDKTFEEIIKAVKQNKMVCVIGTIEVDGSMKTIILPLESFTNDGEDDRLLFKADGLGVQIRQDGTIWITQTVYMEADDGRAMPFNARDNSIINLKDSNELSSAVTKGYTDNSTPTFIFLEEQNGVIQSKATDLEKLRSVLMSQINGYSQTSSPLYKAIKCYAVLNGNCYDLVYSSKESSQEAGKKDTVKRTFYAITTDGLNKLSVLIDENDNVTWTKEAQGVATEQFVVTVTKVGEHDTWESDKTPAEIAASSQAGKQVVLKRQWQSKTEAAYLVSVTDERADFCFIGSDTNTDLEQDFPISGDMFEQEWVTITADKAAKIHREAHSPVFMIQKIGDECASVVSPYNFFNASFWGPASNVYLFEDGEILSGVVVQTSEENSTNYFHIYFPNYAKNKLYDLKWNKDENPSTYTFTESPFIEKPMVVTFTLKDPSTFSFKSDTLYDDIKEAADAGRIVYAFVPASSGGPLFARLVDARSTLVFSGQTNIDAVMIIEMSSDSDIVGTGINLLYCMDKIFGDGDFNAGKRRIKDVEEPVNASDAATKGYVDTSLAAKTEQFIVTVKKVDGVSKSDKTLAEIEAAAKAGKQVVLKDTVIGVEKFCYLVNVDNNVATFCRAEQVTEGMADLSSTFARVWYSILNDQTVTYNGDFNFPKFLIEKDGNGKYTSDLSPDLVVDYIGAAVFEWPINVQLTKDDENLFGTIKFFDAPAGYTIHIYFPDYAKGKVYDLKWNGDKNPSTYTFTELTLDEKPMIVTFTLTDLSTFALKADTSYADIVEAVNKGRIVYALVPNPGPVFGQLTNASSSTLYFAASNGLGQMMSIEMSSDSDISGKFITTLYHPSDIQGGGDFNADSHRIENVKEPIKPYDAATKQYTDDILTAAKSYADNILTAGNSDSVVIKSSTPNSTKKFRITVDDAGAISATEVVS